MSKSLIWFPYDASEYLQRNVGTSRDFLYFGGHDNILRKMTVRGQLIWEKSVPDGSSVWSIGPDNTFDGQYLYMGTQNGNLYKLDVDGNVVASQDVSGDVEGVESDDKGNVYIVRDNFKVEKFNSSFDREWSVDIVEPVFDISWTYDQNGDDWIFACTGHNGLVVAFNGDGDEQWTFDMSVQYDSANVAWALYDIDTTRPWDGNVYAGNADGKIIVVDGPNSIDNPSTATVASSQTDQSQINAVYADNQYTLYYGSENGYYGRKTGGVKWQNSYSEPIADIDVGDRGYMYFVGGDAGNNIVAKASKYDGSVRWRYTEVDGNGLLNVAYGLGGPIPDDDFVYITGWDSNVTKLYASDGQHVWDRSTSNWSVTNYVVNTDQSGTVYVGTENDPATIVRYDVNGTLKDTFTVGGTGVTDAVTAIEFSPDSKYMYYSLQVDQTIHKAETRYGNVQWQFTEHSDQIKDLTTDSNGFIYSASLDETVRKIDSSGNQVWSYPDQLGGTYVVVAHSDGSAIYSGGADNSVHKIDSNGNQVWVVNAHSNTIKSIAIDVDGNIYSGGDDGLVVKYDSTGNVIWTYSGFQTNNATYEDDVWGLAIDQYLNVYAGCRDGTVRKLDSNGNFVWSYDNVGEIMSVDYFTSAEPIDLAEIQEPTAFVYVSYDDYLRKMNTKQVTLWEEYSYWWYKTNITVDSQGNTYATVDEQNFNATNYYHVIKYSPGGNVIWDVTPTTYSTNDVVLLESQQRIYVGGYGEILVIDITDGSTLYTFTPYFSNDGFHRMAIDESGLYGTPTGRRIFEKYSLTGNRLYYFSDLIDERVSAVHLNEYGLYIADAYKNYFINLPKSNNNDDPENNLEIQQNWISNRIDTNSATNIVDMASDEYGNLYVAVTDNFESHRRIYKFTSGGTRLWDMTTSGGTPRIVAVDRENQYFYVLHSTSPAYLNKYDYDGNLIWEHPDLFSGSAFGLVIGYE